MKGFRPLDWVFVLVLVVLAFFAFDLGEGGEDDDTVIVVDQDTQNGKFKKSYAEASDKWTSPTEPASVSVVTYLNEEAHLICRMFDRMVDGGAVADELDPNRLCRGPGVDPTRPPPEPECDWGDCPEDPDT